MIKWYVDGRDYFWAVSVALEQAKESIYIADWWLSPELFLRRPPYHNQEYRLDKLLKKKAAEGVKIFVMVYKEVEQALTCNSAHTKHALTIPKGEPGEKSLSTYHDSLTASLTHPFTHAFTLPLNHVLTSNVSKATET